MDQMLSSSVLNLYFQKHLHLHIIAPGGYGKTRSIVQFCIHHLSQLGNILFICPTWNQAMSLQNRFFKKKVKNLWILQAKTAFSYLLRHKDIDTIILDSIDMSNIYYPCLLRLLAHLGNTSTFRLYILSISLIPQIFSFFPHIKQVNYLSYPKHPLYFNYIGSNNIVATHQVYQQIHHLKEVCSKIPFHRTVIYVATKDECYLVTNYLKCYLVQCPLLLCVHSEVSNQSLRWIEKLLSYSNQDSFILVVTSYFNDRFLDYYSIYYLFDFGIELRMNYDRVYQIHWCDSYEIKKRAMITGRDHDGIVFRLFPESWISPFSSCFRRRQIATPLWVNPLLQMYYHHYVDPVDILGWESYSTHQELVDHQITTNHSLLHLLHHTHLSLHHSQLLETMLIQWKDSFPCIESLMILLSIILLDVIEKGIPYRTLYKDWNVDMHTKSTLNIFLHHTVRDELHFYLSVLLSFLLLPKNLETQFLQQLPLHPKFLFHCSFQWNRCIAYFKRTNCSILHWKAIFHSKLHVRYTKYIGTIPLSFSLPLITIDHSISKSLSRFFEKISWVSNILISDLYHEERPPWNRCYDLFLIPTNGSLINRRCLWLAFSNDRRTSLFIYLYHTNELWIHDLKQHILQWEYHHHQKQYWKSRFHRVLRCIIRTVYYYPFNDGFKHELLPRWLNTLHHISKQRDFIMNRVSLEMEESLFTMT